jgi:uncharacterized membrane protein
MNMVLTLSYFVHLVATVLWLGGLALFTWLVFPEAQRTLTGTDAPPQFIWKLQRRFRPLANLSMVALLGTGMVQMSANTHYEGLLVIDNTWSLAMFIKHLVFLVMVGVMSFIQFRIVPRWERAQLLATRGDTEELNRVARRELNLTRFLLGLSLLVLLCTAVMTAV